MTGAPSVHRPPSTVHPFTRNAAATQWRGGAQRTSSSGAQAGPLPIRRLPSLERAQHRGIAGLALRLLAALSISILPGCAALQPPPAERWPATDPAPVYAVEDIRPAPGLGGELAPDPASTERLLALALQEWQLWGRGRWDAATNLTERRLDEPRGLEAEPYLHARVLLYWLGVKGGDY
ncbi:hypothetical protein FUT87_14055, partial [Mitsuaria sp. TWR114]